MFEGEIGLTVDCVFVVAVAIGGGGGGSIGGTGTFGDDTDGELIVLTLLVENEVRVAVARGGSGVVAGGVCIVGVVDRGVPGCTGGEENAETLE
jgi:hypothetical protein